MDNVEELFKKEVPKATPDEAMGFVTVIARTLPELCHVLNQIRSNGKKRVKIHQILMSQGKLAGQVEIHCLAEVELTEGWDPASHLPLVSVPVEQAPPVA